MNEIRESDVFTEWLPKLNDRIAKARILARLKSAREGLGGRVMKLKSRKFDASEYLDNEELVAEYLTVALEDANPEVFLSAIGDVAKARGMTADADSTGLGWEASTRRSHRAPNRATRR